MTFAGSSTRSLLTFAVLLVLALTTNPAAAQVGAQQQVLTLARGSSELLVLPNDIARISIGDPEVADAVAVSPREVLVNAGNLGTTTLIVWDVNENRRFYTVEVTPNVAALERQLAALFPGENINVIASGGALILSGTVSNAGIARRAVEIATATGATVLDNLITPAAQQILLQVRFAEVSRTAATQIASALSGRNLDQLDEVTDWTVETLSDGLVRLFLLGNGAEFNAVIQALKSNGTFRSLAEPNLVALEGQEASFLAGGEFPFPVPQGGTTNAVTIQFREFGVRLRFTPRITVGRGYPAHGRPGSFQSGFREWGSLFRLRDSEPADPPGGNLGGAAGRADLRHRRIDGPIDSGQHRPDPVSGLHPDPGRLLPQSGRAAESDGAAGAGDSAAGAALGYAAAAPHGGARQLGLGSQTSRAAGRAGGQAATARALMHPWRTR